MTDNKPRSAGLLNYLRFFIEIADTNKLASMDGTYRQ